MCVRARSVLNKRLESWNGLEGRGAESQSWSRRNMLSNRTARVGCGSFYCSAGACPGSARREWPWGPAHLGPQGFKWVHVSAEHHGAPCECPSASGAVHGQVAGPRTHTGLAGASGHPCQCHGWKGCKRAQEGPRQCKGVRPARPAISSGAASQQANRL